MKIAIPVFGDRVSPRFEFAREMLIVEAAQGREVLREKVLMAGIEPLHRVAQLQSLGVDTVICGGIHPLTLELLASSGIRVIAGVLGDVDSVVNQFLAAGSVSPGWQRPRKRGHRYRHRRGRGPFWGWPW